MTIEETIFKHVDEVPLDTLCDYWITKHGWDWVKDVDAHKTKFDTLVCMRLSYEQVLETTEIIVPEASAHKNGYPRYVTTYRIRSEKIGDC